MKKKNTLQQFEKAKISTEKQKKVKGGGKVNWGLVIVV